MSKRIIVVTGPSGVGKTYLAEQLTHQYPELFETAKLYTTRAQRAEEAGSDRIFVSQESFDQMNRDGMFAITGIFHKQNYAYSKDSFSTGQKHTVLNTWPAMIPKFAKIDEVLIVALMPSNELLPTLTKRIEKRGEEKHITDQRKELVARDVAELTKQRSVIDKHGHLFIVKNDRTVPEEIIPWLLSKTKQTI